MVSKASDDFPDPDTPLITVSFPWGISQEMFFKLCVRAPRITIASLGEVKRKSPLGIRPFASCSPEGLRTQRSIFYYRARYAPTEGARPGSQARQVLKACTS